MKSGHQKAIFKPLFTKSGIPLGISNCKEIVTLDSEHLLAITYENNLIKWNFIKNEVSTLYKDVSFTSIKKISNTKLAFGEKNGFFGTIETTINLSELTLKYLGQVQGKNPIIHGVVTSDHTDCEDLIIHYEDDSGGRKGNNDHFTLWHASEEKCVDPIKLENATQSSCIIPLPDNRVAHLTCEKIVIIDYSKREVVNSFKTHCPLKNPQLLFDGVTLIASTDHYNRSDSIKIFDLNSQKEIREISCTEKPIQNLCLNPQTLNLNVISTVEEKLSLLVVDLGFSEITKDIKNDLTQKISHPAQYVMGYLGWLNTSDEKPVDKSSAGIDSDNSQKITQFKT